MPPQKLADRTRTSLAFEAWWRKLAANRALPSYSEFDPLDVPDLVPHLFSCEVKLQDPFTAVIRFSGSETRELAGFNLTGQSAMGFFDKVTVKDVEASVRAMTKMPCGLVQLNDVLYDKAPNAVTEITVLPMKTDNPDCFYLVGLLQWVGAHIDGTKDFPMRILTSQHYDWIDVGGGIPDF
jgi:hypothetical protein